MNMPNYMDYTLSELVQCEKSINAEKFPDRFEVIKKEISLRTEAGEMATEPFFQELVATGVPLGLGIRAWWLFFWRSSVATLIVLFILKKIMSLLLLAFNLPPSAISTIGIIIGFILTSIIGTIIMMQVFSKRYFGYRLYVRKVEEDI